MDATGQTRRILDSYYAKTNLSKAASENNNLT